MPQLGQVHYISINVGRSYTGLLLSAWLSSLAYFNTTLEEYFASDSFRIVPIPIPQNLSEYESLNETWFTPALALFPGICKLCVPGSLSSSPAQEPGNTHPNPCTWVDYYVFVGELFQIACKLSDTLHPKIICTCFLTLLSNS